MTATPQAMEALAHANEVRTSNAALKRWIAAKNTRQGAEYTADIIEHDHDHPHTGRIRMIPLLTSVRRIGVDRAQGCLKLADVRSNKRLCELTPRQRSLIAYQLRLWASVYEA